MGNPENKRFLLNRRELITLGGLAVAGVVTAPLAWEIKKLIGGNFEPVGNLEALLDFTVLPPKVLTPPELRGIIMNSPFLWQYTGIPEAIDRAVENANAFESKAIRVFINDTYEPELSHFEPWVLDSTKALTKKFPLIVDLFDAYSLLHSNKPNATYDSWPLNSPYLVKTKGRSLIDQQLAFFVDPDLVEIFLNRVRSIVGSLKSSRVVAWSVANELIPPVGTPEDKREILTTWYEKVLREIRRLDQARPIVSGVADPTLLDEQRLKAAGLTANTIHLYAGGSDNLIRILASQRKCLPWIIQEIGFPARAYGIQLGSLRDELMASFLVDRLLRFIRVDEKKRTVEPRSESLGIWRLSFEGDSHDDGFQVSPRSLPKTTKVLKTWQSMVLKN